MLAKPEALGESWNLCGDPLALKDYALGVSRQNGWPDPQMKPRTWLDFSYAMDKDNLHAQPNAWRAPEAADALWRITLASPNKVPALQCSALPVY